MLSINRASAGSGKTYALAYDYIRMLLSVKQTAAHGESASYSLNYDPATRRLKHPNRHRRILAITFTKKATEEMKSRILRELDRLTSLSRKADYRQTLMSLMGCTAADLAAAASLALRQLLFDYQSFHVSTIDSFFQRVLHTFARELDFMPDYNVEMEAEEVLHAAVSDMLHDFNAYRPGMADEGNDAFARLEKWIASLMHQQLQSSNSTHTPNFFNRRSSLHKQLLKELSNIAHEHFFEYSDEMRQYLNTDKIDAFAKQLEQAPAAYGEALKRDILPLYDAVEWDKLNGKTMSSFRNTCAKITNGTLDASDINCFDFFLKKTSKTAEALSDGNASYSYFRKGFGSPEMVEALIEIFRIIEGYACKIKEVISLKASLNILYLLRGAWPYLDTYAKDNNALLMWDANDLVSNIIGHDDTPFVYERMGVDLAHFLIDEFQDTSSLQWQNLCPLVLNGLGGGHDSLVIGDEKQSIYRFRNSDSSILGYKVERDCEPFVEPAAGTAKASTNYRSAANIVKFNNTLFSRLAQILDVEGYDTVCQHVSPGLEETPGMVRIYLCSEADIKKVPFDGAMLLKKEEQLHMMAKIIMRQHNEGKYLWSDIAILTNTNKEAKEVVEFLLKNYFSEISVLSDEAMLITGSSAVRLIVSILRLIDKEGSLKALQSEEHISHDHAALALERYEVIYNRLLAEHPDADNEELCRLSASALSDAMAEDADTALASIRQFLRQKPASLLAMVELIIAECFSEEQRQQQCAYLCAFQDQVLEFASQYQGSLHAFLEWWDERAGKLTVTGADETDAVRVLTIHKSKGLEYQCVHIPFCNWALDWSGKFPPKIWSPLPNIAGVQPEVAPPAMLVTIDHHQESESALFHSQFLQEQKLALADQLNRTYVAFTRACSELHVWLGNTDKHYGATIDIALRLPGDEGPLTIPTSDNYVLLSTDSPIPPGLMPDCSDLPDYNPTTETPDKAANRRGYTPIAIYACGAETTKQEKKKEDDPVEALLVPQSPITMEYPVNRHESEKNVLTVDNAIDTETDIDDTPQEEEPVGDNDPARQRGKAYHRIVAATRLPRHLDGAIAAELSRGAITPGEAAEIRAAMEAHIAQCQAMDLPWFQGYSALYIEQPIFIPSETHPRRPDRVAVAPDGTYHLIEYKFTEDELTPEHRRQAQEYAALLRAMGHTVRPYLCYPLKAAIHPL